jgi:hypothetical protein
MGSAALEMLSWSDHPFSSVSEPCCDTALTIHTPSACIDRVMMRYRIISYRSLMMHYRAHHLSHSIIIKPSAEEGEKQIMLHVAVKQQLGRPPVFLDTGRRRL